MNSSEFIRAVDARLSMMSEEEKDEAIRHMALPMETGKRSHFLELLKESEDKVSHDIELEELYKWAHEVEEGRIHFTCRYEETYGTEYWDYGGDKVYEDEYGVSIQLTAGFNLAENLLFQRSYQKAREVYELLFSLTYLAIDEEMEESTSLELEHLMDEELLRIDYRKVILSRIYAIYQASPTEKKMLEILNILSLPSCRLIRLEELFTVGPEALDGVEEFLEEWVVLLKDMKGDRASELLCQGALLLGGVEGLMAAAELAGKEHPMIYKQVSSMLLEEKRYADCQIYCLRVREILPEDLMIRAEICDTLEVAAEMNNRQDLRHRCIKEAFHAESTLMRFLRLFELPDYSLAIQEAVNFLHTLPVKESGTVRGNSFELERNWITMKERAVMELFSGNFKNAYDYCRADNATLGWSSSLKGILIPLFILSLNSGETLSLSGERIWRDILQKLGIMASDYDKITDRYLHWKRRSKTGQEDLEKFISWLGRQVDQRVEAVVGGGFRHSYYKAALLIENYGEMLESRGTMNGRHNTVEVYKKKYPRKRAFKQEFSV